MLFLFDENIPMLRTSFVAGTVLSVSILGKSPSDTEIWKYAQDHNLVIVTKDTDFSDRILVASPPPRVVHLRFGNLRRREFESLLSKTWPDIELLLQTHKLVNVYRDRIASKRSPSATADRSRKRSFRRPVPSARTMCG